MKQLHHKILGEGEPLIILHGLFGMLDNWKTFARSMASDYQLILVDQRNHGRSFHDPDMNYSLMAEDVNRLMDDLEIDQATLLGHSMGGKTAMQFTKDYSRRVNQLVVVDIGPQAYPPGHGFIFDALKAVPVDQIESRTEAEEILAKSIPEKSIQLFLLKNLKRKSDGNYVWRMNLSAIENHYEEILSGIEINEPIKAPTLFVNGRRSKYIRKEDEEMIRNKFAEVEFQHLDTGHWVHAERPEELEQSVKRFLQNDLEK
jgi:pimeloyl-ACP methyl ester carboxylesterase